MLWAGFFNECQKFFVARRAQEGRIGDSPPGHVRLILHEIHQLLQHPLMHFRITYHPGSLVGFRFAGFELGFDQRDNV